MTATMLTKTPAQKLWLVVTERRLPAQKLRLVVTKRVATSPRRSDHADPTH